jgi:hypothetical protein
VSLYNDTHGPVQPDSFRAFQDRALRAGTPLPPLLLHNIRCMPWHFEGDSDELANCGTPHGPCARSARR